VITTGWAIIGIGLIVLGIIIVLGTEAAADRRGVSDRGGRMTRLVIMLFGLAAVYVLLTRR
jgi:hypothetical protein